MEDIKGKKLNNFSAEINEIRKSSNSLCLLVIICFIAMNISAIIIEMIYLAKTSFSSTNIPTLLYYLISGISELVGLFLVGIVYLIIKKSNLKSTLPVNREKETSPILLILISFSICVIANFIVSILNYNLSLFGYDNNINIQMCGKSPVENIFYYLSVALVPALAEEFIFRGIILNSLQKFGNGFAIVVSSSLFALLHGNFLQIPFAFIIGLCLSYLVCKTKSIIPAMVVHLLNNGYSVTLDIVMNNTSDSVYNFVSMGITAIILLLGIISFIYKANENKNFIFLSPGTNSCLSFKSKLKAFVLTPGALITIIIFLTEAVLAKWIN